MIVVSVALAAWIGVVWWQDNRLEKKFGDGMVERDEAEQVQEKFHEKEKDEE